MYDYSILNEWGKTCANYVGFYTTPYDSDNCYWGGTSISIEWLCQHKSLHMRGLWQLDLIEILPRFSYVCADSCECIYDTSINEVVDIPHRSSPRYVAYTRTWISEPSLVVWLWDWVTTDCHCLLQQLVFSKLCHFDRDIFPSKYHGLWQQWNNMLQLEGAKSANSMTMNTVDMLVLVVVGQHNNQMKRKNDGGTPDDAGRLRQQQGTRQEDTKATSASRTGNSAWTMSQVNGRETGGNVFYQGTGQNRPLPTTAATTGWGEGWLPQEGWAGDCSDGHEDDWGLLPTSSSLSLMVLQWYQCRWQWWCLWSLHHPLDHCWCYWLWSRHREEEEKCKGTDDTIIVGRGTSWHCHLQSTLLQQDSRLPLLFDANISISSATSVSTSLSSTMSNHEQLCRNTMVWANYLTQTNWGGNSHRFPKRKASSNTYTCTN